MGPQGELVNGDSEGGGGAWLFDEGDKGCADPFAWKQVLADSFILLKGIWACLGCLSA